MAVSHLPLFCTTYSALVDRHSVATGRYYEAVADLVLLAGKQKGARFAEAKQICVICLAKCKRTAAAMHAHKAAHRC